MTYEELKEHYGVYKSDAKAHSFTVGKFLVMWRWGNACWDSINIKEECYTDYFRIGKVRNLQGVQIYQCILWRLCVTWGLVK
jgi:hypothetical protein